jgi:hypothetical protein
MPARKNYMRNVLSSTPRVNSKPVIKSRADLVRYILAEKERTKREAVARAAKAAEAKRWTDWRPTLDTVEVVR